LTNRDRLRIFENNEASVGLAAVQKEGSGVGQYNKTMVEPQ
jgi:hypothetical protein